MNLTCKAGHPLAVHVDVVFAVVDHDTVRVERDRYAGHVSCTGAPGASPCIGGDAIDPRVRRRALAIGLGAAFESIADRSTPQSCRTCGCTAAHPCDVAGERCRWVSPDLCSRCSAANLALAS
jgi:hypothetical protein